MQGEAYEHRAIECAKEATRRFLARHELGARSVDLAIFKPSRRRRRGLLTAWRHGSTYARGGFAALPVMCFQGAHTAGPIVALDAAMESGQFAAARTILFATVGAGIVVGVALYGK